MERVGTMFDCQVVMFQLPDGEISLGSEIVVQSNCICSLVIQLCQLSFVAGSRSIRVAHHRQSAMVPVRRFGMLLVGASFSIEKSAAGFFSEFDLHIRRVLTFDRPV